MYCTNCGKQTDKSAEFCPHCGIQFDNKSSETLTLNTISRNLAVTIVGGVTSILTAFILAFINQTFNIFIYSQMIWIIIPIGAIGAGLVAASGYYFGAKWFNQKPSKQLILNMLVISIITFYLVYYLTYTETTVNGTNISSLISFSQYMNDILSNMSYCTHIGCVEPGSIQLGAFGYLIGLLQVGGFLAGGIGVYGFLEQEVYCDSCKRYFISKGSQTKFYPESENTKDYSEILDELKKGNYQTAIDKHAHSEQGISNKNVILKTVFKLKFCEKCHRHHLKYSAYKATKRNPGKNDWKEMPKTKLSVFTNEQLHFG